MPATAMIRSEQGFDIFVLRNASLELSAVPELGAKVVSLKNLRTGREWMSSPADGMRLFRNRRDDDFAASTLVGWDECLPTIAPCTWKSRTLSDHGEVWSVAWDVDQAAWQQGVVSTSVRLTVLPLVFQRTIALVDREVQVHYALTNESDEPQSFLWAMHPLLTIHDGDQFDLSPEVRGQLAAETWIDSLAFDSRAPACAKAFAGPLREGRAGIVNSRTGDHLTFMWHTAVNDTLGIWLTRGGWNGHHHLALEPTNGMPDSLAVAAEQNRCGRVLPRVTKSWMVRLCLEP
jgi:galactose mutarotase-like enzyme